ncbi:MAG: hypothetical protein Q8M07_26760 [Prosthecobacter sp.]|nr:hypothetical protein [Prosthecobacter sp.]
MSTAAFRIQGTEAQLKEFEHRCFVTETMFAGTLCDRFKIEKTETNLELVASWLQSARSMGIANHLSCGIKMELVNPSAKPRPRIVCLCGSTRFMDAFRSANLQETIAGRIVLSIGCDTKSDTDLIALGELTEADKAALDELHKRKIDLADEILVLNVDDYIGASTRSELEYARSNGKRVRWLTQSQHALLSEQEPPTTGECA